MPNLVRFSVALKQSLLADFDRHVRKLGYPTRSKAIADLLRESLVQEEWQEGKEVSGAVILVYNHHQHDVAHVLTEIQHEFQGIIISSQHIHLDHDNCLEIVAVRGKPSEIGSLAKKLKALKGIKHSSVAIAATGKI